MEKKITQAFTPGHGRPTAVNALPVAGFIGRKHAMALKQAQALLAVEQPGLFDQLNCGKLGKLLGYLRTGLPGMLLIACYGEYALH